MEGLNIIKTITEKHYIFGTGDLIGSIISLVVGLIILGVFIFYIDDAIKCKKIESKTDLFLCAIFGSIFLIISILGFENYFTRTSYVITKYEVTIDDNLKYKEFTDKYNIISHDGNIYTIQEKSDDNINP